MPIELDTHVHDGAKIRVIGIGGGGGNAINNMILKGLTGVDFVVANTDKQALSHNLAPLKIQVGKDTTRGLGAGANPDVGKRAVEESMDEIKEVLKGSDMIFVTGGMGGGTGTGGAPIIARVGQDIGSLVVAIVTKPFDWEGRKRIALAEMGIKELREHVDALIVIPNQKLLDIIDKNTTFGEAFAKVDEVLFNATRGIADIISQHGRVNVDFADVRTIMKGMGDALMGIGVASGDNRAAEATHNALNSPLLDGISIAGAQGVLVNITGGIDLGMHEVAEAVSIVENATGSDVNLIHGVVYNNEPATEIMVTVVATGFNKIEAKAAAVKEQKFMQDKPKSQQLQFGGKYSDAMPPFKQPSVIFGSRGHFAGSPSAPANGGSMNAPVNSPKGPDELKKYDTPAYERRPLSEALNTFNNDSTVKKAQEPQTQNEHNNLVMENLDKPAFLRKIMD